MIERTKERLARDLDQAGLHTLADKARAGDYDEVESDSALPLTDLACDLAAAFIGGNEMAKPLRQKLIDGDYDATEDEWDAHYNDNDEDDDDA